MSHGRVRPSCVTLVLFAATMRLGAQGVAPLGAEERARVLAASARRVDSLYVDRALARAMGAALRDAARAGRWDRVASPEAFAASVTARLRAIARDEHLRLMFHEHDPRLVENVSPEEKKRRYDDTMQEIADANFGLPEVRILAGNVALLRMDNFIEPWLGSVPLAAAMTMVNHSRALVVDLRRNGGGHSDQYVLMMSYFLEAPVKLGETFSRPDSAIEQSWSYAVVPGPRYATSKPVYVLTGRETFSAAEALAGALRRHRKAVIVGETTRGGGHMGDFHPVGERFVLFVPTAASTTGDDVEGRGLRPDVAVPAERAVQTAHRLALRAIVPAITDARSRGKFERIQRAVEGDDAGTTIR
jgi:retinol-binding protein 3